MTARDASGADVEGDPGLGKRVGPVAGAGLASEGGELAG